MRKIIFSVIAFAAILVSCSSNEDLALSTNVSTSASAAITAYVADNFPETSIVSTTSSGSTIIATLNTGETISFTTSGSVIAYANNASAGLSADSLDITTDSISSVCDSISTDSIGKHEHGKHGHKGGHGIKNGSESDHGKSSKGHKRHFENEIAIDSLSTAINTYISENYSGYTVIHAETDTICQGTVTEVLVCDSVSEPIKLVFDETDTFIFFSERILYTEVPTEISDVVTANYSDYHISKRADKLTLADGSVHYKIFMSIDKVRHSVTFNADGTISCENI